MGRMHNVIVTVLSSSFLFLSCQPHGSPGDRDDCKKTTGCQERIDGFKTTQYHNVTLSVPVDGESPPTDIYIAKKMDVPWGSVEAFDFKPDNLRFATAARLSVNIDDLLLPPGVKKESLRVAALDGNSWKILPVGGFPGPSGSVTALLHHLSLYGLLPAPGETSVVGTELSLNGVTLTASEEVHAVLRVTPGIVVAYLGQKPGRVVTIVLSGLPETGEHFMYVAGTSDPSPVVGGSASVTLVLDEPKVLWVQPFRATVHIGGPADQCSMVGYRDGNKCTLTTDLTGEISIDGDNQALDCSGHLLTQYASYPGSGIGILVSGRTNVLIENCHIGAGSAGYGDGVLVDFSSDVTVRGCEIESSDVAVELVSSSGCTVMENVISGETREGIILRDDSFGNTISGNSASTTLEEGTTSLALRGAIYISDIGEDIIVLVSENVIEENTLEGAEIGILFSLTGDNDVRRNDIFSMGDAVRILNSEWTDRLYHNNINGEVHDAYSETAPAELSYAGEGNFWERSCPGPLFVAGEDSNRPDVVDSHAYRQADAWDAGLAPGCALPGDSDGDGVSDDSDNCPDVWNPGQENADGVDEGDACDVTAPAPPVITFPSDGFTTNEASIKINGTAERMSLVLIYVDEIISVEGSASAEGTFSIVSDHSLEDGMHVLMARCVDAAGNVSGPSDAVSITIDTIATPPIILYPVVGEKITLPSFPVIGSAESESTVVFYLDGIDAGRTTASSEGVFIHYLSDVPDGEHELAAVVIDRAGNMSALSLPVLISLAVISEAAPVVGPTGKSWITGMLDYPDPFDPTLEAATLEVDLQTAGMKALGGNSPNHRFETVLKWDIWDEATGDPTRNLESSFALEPGAGDGGKKGTTTRMLLQWDGRDADGVITPPGNLYGYDVTVSVVRVFTGSGTGPRCSRGELSTSVSGDAACLVDEIRLVAAGTIFTRVPWGLPVVPPTPCELDSPRREERVGMEFQRLMNEHRTRSSAFLASLSPNQKTRLFSAIPEREITTLSVLWSHWNVPMHLGGPFTFLEPYNRTSPEAAALSFISLHRDLYSLCDPASQLSHTGTYMMHGTYPVVAYRQVHEGIIVESGLLHVALDESGSVLSISGQVFPVIEDDPIAGIGADQARNKLGSYLRATFGPGSYDDILDPELLFFDVNRFGFPREVVLAWKVPVIAQGEAGGSWYVDADDGKVWGKTAIVNRMMLRNLWRYIPPPPYERLFYAYSGYDYTSEYMALGYEIESVETGLEFLAGISDWWDTKPFNTLLVLEGGDEMTIKEKFLDEMGSLKLVVDASMWGMQGVWCPPTGGSPTIGACGLTQDEKLQLYGKAAAVTSDGLNMYTIGHEFTHGLHESVTFGAMLNNFIGEFLAYPSGSLFKWFYSNEIADSDWIARSDGVNVSMGLSEWWAAPTWGLFEENSEYSLLAAYSIMGRIFYLGSRFPGGTWDIWSYYSRDVMPLYGEDETAETGMHLSSMLVQSMPLLVPYLQADLTLSKSVFLFVEKTLESADMYANTLDPSDYLNIWIPVIYAVNALGFWSSERQVEFVDPGSPHKGYGKIVATSFNHPGIPEYESLGFFERCGADESLSLMDICWTRRACDMTGGAWHCRWVKESIAAMAGWTSLHPMRDFDVVLTDGNDDGYHDDMYISIISSFDTLGVIHYSVDEDQWNFVLPCRRSDGVVCTEYIETVGLWIESDAYNDSFGRSFPYAAYMDGRTGTINVLDLHGAVFDETVVPIETGIQSIVPPAIAAYQSHKSGYHDYDGVFIAYSSDGSQVTVQRILPDSGCLAVSTSSLGSYDVWSVTSPVTVDAGGPISMVIHPQGVYLPEAYDHPRTDLTGEFNVMFKDTYQAGVVPKSRYQMMGFLRSSANPCSSTPLSPGSSEQLGRDEYQDPGAHFDVAEGKVLMSYRSPENPFGIAYRYRWDY